MAYPPVVRRFIDDERFSTLTMQGAIELLRKLYPDDAAKITIGTVSKHVGSSQAISLKDLETALGLGPASAATVTPVQTLPPPVVQVITRPQVTPPIPARGRGPKPAPPSRGSAGTAVAEKTEQAQQKEPVQDVAPSPGTPARTEAYGEVAAWVDELYAKKAKPTREDFLAAMREKKYTDNDVTDSRFVYALQAAVSKHVSEEFQKKTAITDVKTPPERVKSRPMYARNWTLRHYTSAGSAKLHNDAKDEEPDWKDVRSTVSLGLAGIGGTSKEKKSGHTTDTDWNRYGNVGNTFYVLCIDGKLASDQPFLKNCKWYAEFDFASIPNLWLSSDWLDEAGITGLAMRGSGAEVKGALIEQVGGMFGTDMFLKQLAGRYHNLEIKVPGSLSVAKWLGPVKYPFG